MSRETFSRLRRKIASVMNPPIGKSESIDPLLNTRISFSDFLRPSYESLLDQQKAVNYVLPSINSQLFERIPGLETIEKRVIEGGGNENIYPNIKHGWINMSYEDGILQITFSDGMIAGDEDFASTQYTILRDTKTNKAQIEVQSKLDNGADFHFKKTYEGGYEVYFIFQDKDTDRNYEMKFNYDSPFDVDGPDVTLLRKRPVINGKVNENEVSFFTKRTPSNTTGTLLVNNQLIDDKSCPPYNLQTIFSTSLILLEEITSKLGINRALQV